MRKSVYEEQEPASWRDEYFVSCPRCNWSGVLAHRIHSRQILDELQYKRLEELGTRLRMQRQEAEERKKEFAVKAIDRAPPAKRRRCKA